MARYTSSAFCFHQAATLGSRGSKVSKLSDQLRTAEIDGYGKPHAPGPKCVGNARELRQEFGGDHARIGVDIVYRAAVDPDGCQQSGVIAGAGQVRNNVTALEENGAAGVASLDASIQVVPFIGPTDGRIGIMLLVDMIELFVQRDLTQQSEGTVQHSPIIQGGDKQDRMPSDGCRLQEITILSQGLGK